MQPLSPDEVKWARSQGMMLSEAKWAKTCGLLESESYWSMCRRNPRKAIGCIAGLLFIAAVIGAVIIAAGVM